MKFKIKNNKYIWKNNIVKIEFSNPSIQAFESFIPINDENNIFHYYYDIKIYNKDERNKNWKIISKISIYDFPGILKLKEIINYLKNYKISIDKEEDYETLTYSNESFMYEDFYELTKIMYKNNFYYNFYIGCVFNSKHNLYNKGIKLLNLSEKDMDNLINCIDSFIKYSIEKYNEEVILNNSLSISSRIIMNDKIYEYKQNNENSNRKIECFYTINDNVDIYYLIKYNNKLKVIKYSNIFITNINQKDNSLELSNGEKLYLYNIVYINDNVSYEKLYYNVDKIVNDFYSILNKNEKIDFINLNVKQIYKKYNECIIHRTWMCRNEHDFKYDRTGDSIKDLKKIVIEIICKIKEKIEEE